MGLAVLQCHVIELRRDLDHDRAVNRLAQTVADRQHAMIRPNHRSLVTHDFQHIVTELPGSPLGAKGITGTSPPTSISVPTCKGAIGMCSTPNRLV